MPRVPLHRDERYPHYSIDDHAGSFVDVDDATLERWQAAMREYERVQGEMNAALARYYFDGRYWHDIDPEWERPVD